MSVSSRACPQPTPVPSTQHVLRELGERPDCLSGSLCRRNMMFCVQDEQLLSKLGQETGAHCICGGALSSR